MSLNTYIALLRGINVSGRNKIPMAELRSLCAEVGLHGAQTYIQSGNIIFQADTTSVALETTLEQAIERRFGFSIAVIVRMSADWPTYVTGNPFPNESQNQPNLVMLALSKSPLKAGAVEGLRERATNGEQIAQVGDALWIHYANSVQGSKLSPALFDRLAGSPVTARNWRTVLKLNDMLAPL